MKKELLSDYFKSLLEDADKLPFLGYSNAKEFAKYIGISHTYLNEILLGKHNSLSPLSAVRLCRKLNMEPELFFEKLENVDDKFIDNFFEKYNGVDFEDKCKGLIKSFYSSCEFVTKNKDDEYIIFSDEEEVPSLNKLKFLNTNEKSIYDCGTVNATCVYELYNVGTINNNGNEMLLPTKKHDYLCSIYYLPSRRIRKTNDYIYADEEIRDFTNKFLYLIKSKHVPINNIFITSSKKLFDKIVNFIGDSKIIPTTTNLGIILVCDPNGYSINREYKILIDNGNEIENVL